MAASIHPFSLTQRDKAYIWHPFTQMQTPNQAIAISRAKGIYLYGEKEESYIDGISSWFVNLHGHCHPYIAEKIKKQLDILEHVIFAGFTHAPAVHLADRLLALLPGKMSKVFYSDNGATAVEIALKMALQYWYNLNRAKSTIICFKHSYHGDTFGAMSAAGKNAFNRPFWKYLFDVECIDPPLEGKVNHSLSQLKKILDKKQAACFIFEPLILGIGGMIIYPPNGLNYLIRECKKHHVLTIADEVLTGFGRTQTLFACEQLIEKPDLICLSKGITGGFLPLAVTACTEDIFNAFLGEHLQQAFLHGHSYTANPLACSSALANLDLLLSPSCYLQRETIAAHHQIFCQKWSCHPKLKRCESIGTILVIEYKVQSPSYFVPLREKLYTYFLQQGILLRPLGNVLYVFPPFCIEKKELYFIYDHIVFTLEGEI